MNNGKLDNFIKTLDTILYASMMPDKNKVDSIKEILRKFKKEQEN